MFYDNTMQSEMRKPIRASEHLAISIQIELEGLTPGTQVPSVRELTKRHKASPVTVQRAITHLVRAGLIVTKPGHGTFKIEPPKAINSSDLSWQSLTLGARTIVSDEIQTLLSPPSALNIPLGSGYPDESLQPLAMLAAAMTRAGRRPGIWARAPLDGLEPLRAWFAQTVGGEARAGDVLIVPGGQAAVSSTMRAIVPPGEAILFESPTYFGALAVAQSAGIRAVPVPTDSEGIRPDLLEVAFKNTNARAVYLQPLYANPTGSSLGLERRRAVLEVATRAGAFIIEDDYARELTLDGTALPPMFAQGDGRVVYIRSLSKCAAPSLRVAAVIAKGAVMNRLRTTRAVDDLFVSLELQEVALELVTSSGWQKHLKRLRDRLRARRDATLKALALYFPQARVTFVPMGGFSIWLELPQGTNEILFAQNAMNAGVQISAGRAWFPAEAPGSFMRLSFAACDQLMLEEGIKRLGKVWLEQQS
jgi:DNA-binding transcriptional MocR family regulator